MTQAPLSGTDFLGIDISGIDSVNSKLVGLYPAVADAGVENANDYLLHALKQSPPYTHVPWSRVGGFFTDRQRRYVFAMINQGFITPGQPNRSGMLNEGWRTYGDGKNQIVTNEVSYAPYVVGDSQTSMLNLSGWHLYTYTLQKNMTGIMTAFKQGVARAIVELGLG